MYLFCWFPVPGLRHCQIHAIPTVGPSLPIISYLGAWQYFRNAKDMLLEGCSKHEIFKLPLSDQWLVVVNGPKMNDELRKYPDESMSAFEAHKYVLQTEYTLGTTNPDATAKKIIAGPLTRKLPQIMPELVDEIIASFEDIIPKADNGETVLPPHVLWTRLSTSCRMGHCAGLETMTDIIARVTNRAFVGLPFCRDQVLMKTFTGFAKDVMKTKTIINMIPNFLSRDIVGPRLPWTSAARRRMAAILGATVVERRRQLIEYGTDYEGKPDDYLTWCIEEDIKFRGKGDSIDGVMEVISASNFAAIHTSSMSMTHALYYLCAFPEYVEPLRREAEEMIRQHGWTKAAVDGMWKADSFFKEALRLNSASHLTLFRKAMKPIVFSNGTVIPVGTMVVATTTGTHLNEELYEDATEFKPFRFSEARAKGGDDALRQQFHTSSPDYIPFGHGKHACSGRWFAAGEVKAVLAYILLNYDVKLFEGGGRPANLYVGPSIIPNPWAKMMFRKRKTSYA
ncbi:cytochrome P450 [Fomitopsis serialis]|uniref:cytochrome P450 n=1 Tax=Fomitopsis serialis TaxID=139415 RepID=UPI0020083F50|nr:cytochrome P450 [Neoantrodia serialis]KAH9923621.1 cytochrome P450 [Neoantrodia serialis]